MSWRTCNYRHSLHMNSTIDTHPRAICIKDEFSNFYNFYRYSYSLSPGFWQSFISIEVCRDCIPALASSCKKQLTGFFVCLLFFLKVKRIS